MSRQLSEQEVRQVFAAMELSELIELAEKEGHPTAGASKEDLIERLLGNCSGCKKKADAMTVVYIPLNGQPIVQNNNKQAPCLGCGK